MLSKKINIAVIGATGYVGLDLIYLLSRHPNANIKYICAQKKIGKSINFFDKRIKKKLPKISKSKKIDWNIIDLVFLSLPNGQAQKLIKQKFFKHKTKFIDLSADFRLSNSRMYKVWYKKNHSAKQLINKSLYSISEFVKKKITNYRIIANPGCYPTSIQLALCPLLKKGLIDPKRIIIDSKSGYSGAGKNFKEKFKHKNILSSVHAYGIFKHRHMSELDQELKKYSKIKIKYVFNPYLIPMFRGILSSIYVEPTKKNNIKKIFLELKRFYKKEKFIKIHKINTQIGTGSVINTNNCEISICKTSNKNKILILSAIDNLVKGASGQAVQNMNLMYGFKQTTGLK